MQDLGSTLRMLERSHGYCCLFKRAACCGRGQTGDLPEPPPLPAQTPMDSTPTEMCSLGSSGKTEWGNIHFEQIFICPRLVSVSRKASESTRKLRLLPLPPLPPFPIAQAE